MIRIMFMRFCILLALQLALSSCLSLAFAESWTQRVPTSWRLRGGDISLGDDDITADLPPLEASCDVPRVWAKGPKRGIIFMDKFTPYFGFYLSQHCREAYGVAAINVFSDYMVGFFLQKHPGLMEPLRMRMPREVELQEWLKQLPVEEIVGIICESDAGLADAEKFGVMLGLQNHDGINEARRNKYLTVEAVGKAGLAVVRQRLCHTPQEAVEFAKELGVLEESSQEEGDTSQTADAGTPVPTAAYHEDTDAEANTGSLGKATNVHHSTDTPMCIVKPIRGSGTDSVFLCKSQSEVETAFNLIHGMPVFDSPREMHDSVLIQEFVSGTEYAIDVVSKNGEHKVAALWRYDKRPANGASFVYHATEIIDADTPVGQLICDYATKVLDALGIRWGQTHSEVILGTTEPLLVEVNCRQHNMDFAPLTMACIGYNSLDMLLASYLGGNDEDTYPPDTDGMRLDWERLPKLPTTRAYGAVVHLINFANGILLSLNKEALKEIEDMESVCAMEIYPSFCEVGSPIIPTIDIRTDAGWVHIISRDKEAFQRDYERIVELMPELFEVDSR